MTLMNPEEVLQTCLEAGADTDKDGNIDRDEFRGWILQSLQNELRFQTCAKGHPIPLRPYHPNLDTL